MNLEMLICPRCGGPDLERISDEEICCPYCGLKFHDDSASKKAREAAAALEEKERAEMAKKVEKMSGLKKELYEATAEKYIDNKKILDLCAKIKVIDPDDFFAGFYEVAALDQTKRQNEIKLCEHLDNLDLELFKDYLDTILDYMLKSLVPSDRLMASVGNLIEKAYHASNPAKYGQYRTKFEEEVKKVNSLAYDLTVPRDIFLCYASADMDKVMSTLTYFEDRGLRCFMAVRNLQHGNDAVNRYDAALKTAIDHCKAIVFISTNNSRSVRRDTIKELRYLDESDRNRKTPITRIELVLEPYNKPMNDVETIFKSFFEDGHEFDSVEDVYENIFDPDREEKKKRRECAAAPVFTEEDMILCDPLISRNCFIGYDSENEEIAKKLSDYLENNGVSCFLESRNTKTWDKNDQDGYFEKIKDAINNCECFILVSTKASRSYKSICKKEMDYIKKTEKTREVPIKKIHFVADNSLNGDPNAVVVRSFFGAIEDVYNESSVFKRFMGVGDKAPKKKEKEEEPFDINKVLPRDVFLVYNDKDVERADELVVYLEENGLTCFYRKRDFKGDYAEFYKNLKAIIDGCLSVAFVSSNEARTATSNCKKELDVILSLDKNRNEPIKKVEYLIESYSGKPIDKVFQRYFLINNTYNSSPSNEEVFYKLLGSEVEEEPVEETKPEEPKDVTEKEVKFCKFCGAENPLNTRYCCDCGETSFVDTRDEYLRLRRASKKELERIQENEYQENSAGLKNNTIIYASSDQDDYEVDNRNRANSAKSKGSSSKDDNTPMERALADFYSDSSSSKPKGNAKNNQNSKQDEDFDFASFYADGNSKKSNKQNKNNNDEDFDFASFYADGNKNNKNAKNNQKAKQDDDFDFASFYADGNAHKKSNSSSNEKHRENAARPAQNAHNRDYTPMPSLNRIELQVGQRIVVSENINQIMLAFKATAKLDNFESNTFMFLLGPDDKVRNEGDLIFFNNDSTISNSIVLTSEEKNYEKININLAKLSNNIEKVAFVYSVVSENGVKLNFSMASELMFLIDIGDNEYVMKINNIDRTSKSIYLFELYKYKNIWKVRVVGLPTNKDIDKICQEYGVDIA